ncbi:PRC-barrel domain-containing protein [Glacieibacterium frigidum]|uniref:PRC-barrel domain containing protein n=1 Tax=Glacieibacterium frigidum TaxID=2593303 RepID=A0A552UJB4_9SPHN|nr:PRC-barrel domain-containing protein [Glacieibacterium frigidum]TRW18261.1 PRC-barrel domain containing protein [Glacieibacterium frigidum]
MTSEATVADAPQATLIAVGAILESPVKGKDGETLGKIAEIMLTAGQGAIAYVVLARGGVLGVGETLHAISWCDFTVDPEDGALSLPLSGADLDARGGFDKDHWPAKPVE